MEGEGLKSLLREAASKSIDSAEIRPFKSADEKTHIMEVTEENLNKWNNLKEKMEGPFAERFINEMESLSGREFVRTYLKVLEYFKPKIVRVENKPVEEEDTVLRIEIYNAAPVSLNPGIIDITQEEDDEN